MEILLPALIMLAISASYFWLGRRESVLWVRILFSMHGLSAVLLYAVAMALWAISPTYRPWAALPYLLLHIIPAASIIFSLFRYPGSKLLHFTQVVNVGCMLQTIVIGSMAITGDWL